MTLCGIALALSLGGMLGPADIARVRAAFQKLDSATIEATPAASLPPGIDFIRVDVSQGMRSASFGHKTTLVVPNAAPDAGTAAPTQFWVEYGRSTNSPARLFGPFTVQRETTKE